MDAIDSHPSCSSEEDLLEVHQDEEKTWRVFVGGLLEAHSDADVSSLFASFGIKVLSIDRLGPYKERVYYRRDKRIRARYERRIAFLTCRTAGESDGPLQKALRSLHGTRWKGTTLRCQIAKPSGIDVIRDEIEMDELLKDVGEASDVLPMYQGDLGRVGHTIHFDDDDEFHGPAESLWIAIETPKQAVYNYEKHLEMCQALSREQCQDDNDNDDHGDNNKISAVEAFLQAQDAARLKRREERRQASLTTHLAKEKDGEDEASMAVVEFASDEDDGTVQKNTVDLSRFDDSDDDVIPQVDGEHDGTSSSSSDESSSDDSSSRSTHDSLSESSDTREESDSEDDLAAILFPGGASFHVKDEITQAQEQAKVGAQSERIRTSLKQYRKRARRISSR